MFVCVFVVVVRTAHFLVVLGIFLKFFMIIILDPYAVLLSLLALVRIFSQCIFLIWLSIFLFFH